MGTQALEWDGITLPVKAIKSEKERKTLWLLLGYGSLPVKLEELFSLTIEAVCLGGRDSVSPAEEGIAHRRWARSSWEACSGGRRYLCLLLC